MNAAIVTLALLAPTQPARTPEPPTPVPDVTESVRSGLKWLASKQKADGSFDAPAGTSPTTVTAQSGIAFLMQGSTLKHGTYAPELQKIVAWLEKNAAKDGRLASNTENEQFQYVPSHAQALLFLVCAYDVDDDADRRKRLAIVLDRAIEFAVDCQTTRGGWGYIRPAARSDFDDCYTTATMLQALFAARKAGIEVPRRAIDNGVQHLVRATNRRGEVVYSIYNAQADENGGQPMNSAAAAAVILMSDRHRPAQLPQWTRHGVSTSAQMLQFLRNNPNSVLQHHFYLSRAAFALGESGHAQLEPDGRDTDRLRWSTQRATIHKALKGIQAKDGSWPDPNFGPVSTTALALIVLQLDNDYLPAFSR